MRQRNIRKLYLCTAAFIIIFEVAMERLTMAVPCLFGLEGLVGDELRRMQMENVRA